MQARQATGIKELERLFPISLAGDVVVQPPAHAETFVFEDPRRPKR